MNRIRIFQVGAVFVLLATAIVSASGQTAQAPLPPPTGYVNDYAKVIDRATKQRLETTLANLDQQRQVQFAFVPVGATGGHENLHYTLTYARCWCHRVQVYVQPARR